ncbi:MAG: HD domain-containing phosphohydrolase [Thermodesulfobacteriota bacterium]
MSDEASQQTILFVDDEESILEIASEHFRDMGYRVLTAKNGVEAIGLLDQHTVDCCFTDINMPEMDGLEFAEYLRNADNTIPVVVMTGYPSLDNTIRTLKNGVVDFLIKPINLNQMSLCLKRVLRERELFIKNLLLNKELESKKRIESLNEELSGKVSELRILNKIMSELVALRSGAEVFDHMVRIALDITVAEDTAFFLVSDSVERPISIAAFTRKEGNGEVKTIGSPPSGSSSGASVLQPECDAAVDEIIQEIVSDEVPMIVSKNAEAEKLPPHLKSFIGIPLTIRDSVFGVLVAAVAEADRFFAEKDLYYLTFMTQQAAYMVENLALYENIYENLFATLSAFVKAVEARDAYTKQHSYRVTEAAKIIARRYGCSKAEIDVLDFAGRLHDMGKIGIRDDILLKPGPLTPEEFEKIKDHPTIGESIIAQLGLWDREKIIIRHHHERYDGTGYPDGLAGQDIPLLARILSIADVYDAMISGRAYRKEMPSDDVLHIIESESGRQFDPEIVAVFLELYRADELAPVYRYMN